MPIMRRPVSLSAMVLHISDLIALALGATRDAAELAGTRGVPADRLDAMKKLTLEQLGDLSL